MANDDEVLGESSYEPADHQPGARRSTFTPPTESTAVPGPGDLSHEPNHEPSRDELTHDDDELASALAAELGRVATGSFAAVRPDLEPESAPEPEPEPDVASNAGPAFESVPEPVSVPESISEPMPDWQPEPVAEAAPEPDADATPAWMTLPAPDPAQAVVLPEGPPDRVLSDPELLGLLERAGLEPGGTLNVIEQLEAQLKDREVPSTETAQPPLMPLVTPPPAPTAQAPDAQAPDAQAPDAQQPAAQAPIDGFVSPETPLAAWPTPNFGDDVPVAQQPQEEVFEQAPPPPPPLPAWDVPPPSADWSPGPEFGVDEPVADVTPEPELEPETQPEPEPAPDLVEPRPLAEPEPDTETGPETIPESTHSPFAPPPLVEPPPLGGAPVLPSEAAGHPPVPTAPIPDYEEVIEAEVIEDDPVPRSASASSAQFSFDDLLSGAGTGDDDSRSDNEGTPFVAAAAAGGAAAAAAESLPVTAREGVSLDTDSISVIDQSYEEELDDDVDDTDRAFGGLAGGAPLISPPSGPISTVRIPDDEVVLLEEPARQRVFSLETAGLEPTPVDQRIGRAARLFWLWFAANSSILSVGLGAAIFALGMSLRQSIVAVLAGVALSFIPLGLTTLAGKRSGQPTMVTSRATFGLLGNVVPAVLALVSRVFWGAVLLWVLASSTAIVLVRAQLDGGLGERLLLLIALAGALLIAVLIAFAGYTLIARIQLIFSLVSGLLIAGLIAMTFQYIDVADALTTPDGPWILTVTGAVLVFSFVGLVWAFSGADLARYQRPGSSGAASMLWSSVGATLPTFVLIGYGALLAASDKGIASGFVLSPLDTLAIMLPAWYPAPLLLAAALSLLSGIVITLYSGGFALQSIGVRVARQWSMLIVGALLAGLALVLTFGVTGGITELFRDAATTLAVPTAAWAGIFAAEMMIRRRRFDSGSLLTAGGAYETVRWGNLIGLVTISAIGFGLTSATVTWLGWQGYLFGVFGVPLGSDLAGSDLGVLVALLLGILLPLIIGVPAIRRQEQVRV